MSLKTHNYIIDNTLRIKATKMRLSKTEGSTRVPGVTYWNVAFRQL